MSKLIEVTILVPEQDISITEASVTHEQSDRDTPSNYDATVREIEIMGMDYTIESFDDTALELKAIEEWKDK